jgi:hypothetical protein
VLVLLCILCALYYPHRARLIAKDGVYLSTVPRLLDESKLLFAFGARVDIAINCPVGTFNMDMVLVNDVDQNTMAAAGPTVGALIAVRHHQHIHAHSIPRSACFNNRLRPNAWLLQGVSALI